MYIVLLGAPGAGKGTIAKILSQKLNLTHISTGDIFRNEMKEQTEVGEAIVEYMEKGLLVPDNIVLEVIEKRLQKDDVVNGAILDGFPRTVVQAKALKEFLKKNNPSKSAIAINLSVEDDEIIKRIVNRRTCSKKICGAIYNLESKPPKEEGICDICGSKLVKRHDDTEETVKRRLEIYHENSKDLIEFYKNNNMLYFIYPDKPEKAVEEIKEYINKVEGSN